MPTEIATFGVPTLQIGYPNQAAVLTGLTAATTTIAQTAPSIARNSNRQLLPIGSYKAWITLMGFDPLGGYAITQSTATAGTATSTSAVGQGLLVRIAAALPATMVNSICAAIWLQVGSANPQLCDFAIINPALDFSFTITGLPNSQAPFTTTAILTATTADSPGLPVLGSTRTAIQQVLYGPAYETTGGVNLRHRREGFTASPDHSLNYPITTGRATDVTTRILSPKLASTAQQLSADYVTYTDTDTATTQIEQVGHDVFQTASSVAGNAPVLVQYPADQNGRVLRRLFVGMLTANTADFEENNRKDAQTELAVTLTSAGLDTLVQGMATGIARID